MAITLRYHAAAAHRLLDPSLLEDIQPAILAARDEVLSDVELLKSGKSIPNAKQPLDSGFIELPLGLLVEELAEDKDNGPTSLLKRTEQAAQQFRSEIDRVVLLGIGGSFMGTRALYEALCHPLHNELDREQRRGVPRLYFEGNNVDNDTVGSLLQLLTECCRDNSDLRQRWGIIVISKSGGTLETAVAFRLFRQALEAYYGADSAESRCYVVAITGETGKLRDVAAARDYRTVLSIPDNVGGRFSVFTPVGLFPAAVLGLDFRQLARGAADMTDCFRDEPFERNPVLQYTATCHLFEQDHGLNIRVLSTWGKRLEALGTWYDQLLAESLGKNNLGATPITVVNTRDLHSRGQQHQEGTRDKLITNLIVEEPATEPITIPEMADDKDNLNRLSGKSLPNVLSAAIEGTNRAYAAVDRPTADLVLPKLDEYGLGQLMQMLMLATVVEGRMIGVNPYGQPGVEAYKKNMNEILLQS